MATSLEVIQYLRPNGGWVLVGDNFEGISFYEAASFTKEEFEAAFDKCDEALLETTAQKATDKAALLVKLGITADEAALLLGGN